MQNLHHGSATGPSTGTDCDAGTARPLAAALVDELVAARRDGRPADDVRWQGAPLTLAGVYAVHDGVEAAMGWRDGCAPGAPSHWKSGGTPAQPTFVRLPSPFMRASPARWPLSGTATPAGARELAIEIEVAFRVGQAVTPGNVAALAALAGAGPAAVFDAMAVAIELVDFRWQGRAQAAPLLRLADLQSHEALVIGDWTPLRPVDWARQRATLHIDGRPAGASPFTGSHPFTDPLWATGAWLAHVVARHGGLAAGSVVTTGSWCGMAWQRGPARVVAAFDGIGTAEVVLAAA